MKKRLLTSSFALLFLFSSTVATAHPGRTDANGGHTCWTNCSRWGLEYGEYHYHNGGHSSSGSKKSSSGSSSKSSRSNSQTSQPKPAPKPSYQKSSIKVFVNGNRVEFANAPLIYENTNLVPLRDLVQALGAGLSYDQSTGTIGVTKGSYKVTLTVGSNIVFYNGTSETASAAPKIINGVTYVPLQVIVKGLGAGMAIDSADHSFKITIK
ncbi:MULTISPECIES: copper amine oxidase N-terminal domain-containing protein [Paenibacillus]|uniref:Copper amine oxidase-like N-terminal domain-containing protein n=1 Tax=Paenibacillus albilobatus TaxID=2716884 RepID=A0A919XGR0_9BACL|nr:MULTISPECIES: copper amine oxidase N-terminal domain-containing protein [Paenibacillus]GIO31088.1 hypothetical protein J2TS6_22290 [Paenibacillus albilobatus]